MKASLSARLHPAQPAGFEGQWHAIEFQPELSVPQRFVIGVALSQKGKLTHMRVAEEAGRLKCFYGNRFTADTWQWLRTELLADLNQARGTTLSKLQSASPQIMVSAGHYASGSSADAALSRTFERVVTVVSKDRAPRAQGITQPELRKMMARLLKVRMSTGFEAISQSDDGVLIANNGTVHAFDVTYDDGATASSVVSACYAGLDTAKMNVMAATNDLATFTRIRKREQIGLAVLQPSTEFFAAESVRAWQDWWGHFSYKLRESDLVLLAEASTPEALAEQVSNWYDQPTDP